MITTNKYMIKFSQINFDIIIVSILDNSGKIVISEKMPLNTLFDISTALFYLLEENACFDMQLPANNTQYGYIIYGGKSMRNYGLFQILLTRQNFTNKEDYLIADEFLEYYELKNIINDIGNFCKGCYYEANNR